MSLIGCTAWYSTIGLDATRIAAQAPVTSSSRRRPYTKVSQTSSAALTGTTTNTADGWTREAAAITSDNPGGQIGTARPYSRPGANPVGANTPFGMPGNWRATGLASVAWPPASAAACST